MNGRQRWSRILDVTYIQSCRYLVGYIGGPKIGHPVARRHTTVHPRIKVEENTVLRRLGHQESVGRDWSESLVVHAESEMLEICYFTIISDVGQ